jgi:hypothetical protein
VRFLYSAVKTHQSLNLPLFGDKPYITTSRRAHFIVDAGRVRPAESFGGGCLAATWR